MCECIEKTENMLTEKMLEKHPGFEVLDDVQFQNKSYVLDKNGGIVLNNPVLGKVKKGKQIKRFEVSMFPKYCPFCGEKFR